MTLKNIKKLSFVIITLLMLMSGMSFSNHASAAANKPFGVFGEGPEPESNPTLLKSNSELLTFSDLQGLNSNPVSIREYFKQYYGVSPDGIAINSETYYNAVNPPITEQYGYYAYKNLGEVNYDLGEVNDIQAAIVGSNYAYNYSDEEATVSLTVNGGWTSNTTVSSSITTGLSYTSTFKLDTVFSTGVTLNASVTAGQSYTEGMSQSASSTVQVTVPPHSKKLVTMTGILKEQTMHFTVPINITGWVGANFPKRVDGHYFWFHSVDNVLDKTSGEIKGSVKNTNVLDIKTEIGESEPIDE
ncbi:hypothetical protein [Jeotgalibacillus marinus]|uniref:Uncharacterized protein n=1 Tax=Jeotgalibacillus marinus TaxID=86667 RepID=A0ABV3Q2X4_9BACL